MSYADEEWCRRIHERLLAGDHTAYAELAETLGPIVLSKLESAHPRQDLHMLEDATWDAIRAYFERPTTFDSMKKSLIGYLVMSARGDLQNAIAKVRRRQEEPIEDVELRATCGNRRQEQLEARMDLIRIRKQLDNLFTDPADRKAVELMVIDEERSTAVFAAVWGLTHLSPQDQARQVKRGKDRLKKALQRMGEGLRERES